jgi:hypothetical protein
VGSASYAVTPLSSLPISASAHIIIDAAKTNPITLPTPGNRPVRATFATRAARGVPEGGIFAAGPLTGSNVWAFRLTGDAALAWKQESEAYEGPFVVGAQPAGGYWVAGVAQTRDPSKEPAGNSLEVQKQVQFEYMRRFGAEGSVSAQVPISQIGENHFLTCGLAVPGGYILTGSAPNALAKNLLSPWIELIDTHGQRRWERTFSELDNRALRDSGFWTGCAGLHIAPDKKITWATHVLTNYVVDTPNGRAVVQPQSFDGFWGTFLAQLDFEGHDIVRVFRPEMQFAHLERAPTGFVLFESYVGEDQNPSPTLRFARRVDIHVDYGLHITWFDNSLHAVKQSAFAPDEWSSTVHAIYATPEGGYVLASCEGFQGPSFLRYLTPAGQFSQREVFPSRNQCDQFVLGPGKERGTVVVLGSTLSEATAVVAKYSD